MIPLVMPDAPSGIAKVLLELERIDYAAPELSGKQGGVQAGWPLWSAIYELDRSDRDSADLWHAFVARLRGRQRLFLGGDPTRDFPRNYPMGFAGLNRAAGGAFNGNATSWSQAFDANGNAILSLLGMPTGMVFAPRDLIGFKWDAAGFAAGTHNRRTMAMIVSPVTSDGGGGLQAMIEPPIDTSVVPPGAIVHFDQPRCLMRQVTDKTKLGAIGTGSAMAGGAIVGMQELRP
jgi:hypothetical protein